MRGKKKKGVIVKPGTEAAMAAAMLEKLKKAGLNVPGATPETENGDRRESMTQSEYTYYSETTNEDTIASKADDRHQVGVAGLKNINIEASLE